MRHLSEEGLHHLFREMEVKTSLARNVENLFLQKLLSIFTSPERNIRHCEVQY